MKVDRIHIYIFERSIEMAGKSRCSDDEAAEEEDSHTNIPHQNGEEDDVTLSLDMNKLSLGHHKDNESESACHKKKFLLIFDLNGLLVHRVHGKDKLKIPKNRRPDAVVSNRFVFRRPFCEEFMLFCLEKFEVGIWSSAMEHNADGVMEAVFGELRSKLLFLWNQKQCSDYGIKCEEKKDKPLFFKELSKVWESKHKQFDKGSFSATNTLLLDDTPSKGLLNPPNTGIYPDSYDPEDGNDNALDPKSELGLYLKELAEAEDVPSYVASHPFGQPPIKAGHPRWSFYSQVLSSINAKKEAIVRS